MKSGNGTRPVEHSGSSSAPKRVEAVARAARLLKAFSIENPVQSLSQLAKRANVPKSTAHRILMTLMDQGFVTQLDDARFAPGVQLFAIGSLAYANLSIGAASQESIAALAAETGETVHLGILDGFEVVSIEQVPSPHSLRANVHVGKRAPLYCTSVGKVLAAYNDTPHWQEAFRAQPRFAHTPNTITDVVRLGAELEKVRQQGYAVDNEEHEKGIRCVAAAIRDVSGKVVASLSVSGAAARLQPENVDRVAELVMRYAGRISAMLGYRALEQLADAKPSDAKEHAKES